MILLLLLWHFAVVQTFEGSKNLFNNFKRWDDQLKILVVI